MPSPTAGSASTIDAKHSIHPTPADVKKAPKPSRPRHTQNDVHSRLLDGFITRTHSEELRTAINRLLGNKSFFMRAINHDANEQLFDHVAELSTYAIINASEHPEKYKNLEEFNKLTNKQFTAVQKAIDRPFFKIIEALAELFSGAKILQHLPKFNLHTLYLIVVANQRDMSVQLSDLWTPNEYRLAQYGITSNAIQRLFHHQTSNLGYVLLEFLNDKNLKQTKYHAIFILAADLLEKIKDIERSDEIDDKAFLDVCVKQLDGLGPDFTRLDYSQALYRARIDVCGILAKKSSPRLSP